MPVTHSFVSDITDSSDTDLVRPSNWNANHVVVVNLSSEVTGTLPVSSGGTGQTTFTDGILQSTNDSISTTTSPSLTSLTVDNIKLDGNTISITDTDGNLNLTPNGTGTIVADGVAITDTQFGYVGNMDQNIDTTTAVQFHGLSVINNTALETADILTQSSSSKARLLIDSGSNKESVILFQQFDVDKWSISNDRAEDGGNDFTIYNHTTSKVSLSIDSATDNVSIGNGNLDITGNITVSGTVDGVDIAALKTDVDAFPDALQNLTTAEINQLENIGSTTISATQWGYLGNLNQDLTTQSDVQFNNIKIEGDNEGLRFANTDNALVDSQRNWGIEPDLLTLLFKVYDSTYSTSENFLKVTRSGSTVSAVAFENGSVSISESLTVGGSLTVDHDISQLDDVNDASPFYRLGSDLNNHLQIQTVYDTGAQTIDYVLFRTVTQNAIANKGLFRFEVDDIDIVEIHDSGVDVQSGFDYQINSTSVLNATTLGSGVVTSSLTTVGALNSGSIASDFGNIDIGDSSIDGGTITAGTAFVGTLSTAAQPNITSLGTLSSLTVSGTLTAQSDADGTHVISRAKIGTMSGPDIATFSHFDSGTTTGYSLLQTSVGETVLNSATGQNLSLRINNVNAFVIDSSSNVNVSTGNLTLSGGNLGVGIASPISVAHIYENTTEVDANAGLTIEQDGTGDAVTQWLLTGGQRYVAGIDNSDLDKWKLSTSVDLNSNSAIEVDTSQNVEFPNGNVEVSNGTFTASSFIHSESAVLVGVNDTTNGTLTLYGSSTINGGAIHLYNPADQDTTFNHFEIEVVEDDLYIERTGSTDLKLDASGNFHVQGGTASFTGGNVDVTRSVNSGNVLTVENTNSGSSAYSGVFLDNDGASVCAWFMNSSTRTIDGGTNTATLRNDAGTLRLQSSGAVGISITSGDVTIDSGNILLGTTTNATGTEGKVLVFGDNGGNPTMGTNTAGIFAKDVSGTVEMFAVDEADNVTQISPHDPETGEYYYYCENKKTGKRTRIDIERFFKYFDRLYDTDFYHQYNL